MPSACRSTSNKTRISKIPQVTATAVCDTHWVNTSCVVGGFLLSTFKTPLKGFLTITAFHSTLQLRLAVSGVGSSRPQPPEYPVTGQWTREGSEPVLGVPGKILLGETRASPFQAPPWPPAGWWVRPPPFLRGPWQEQPAPCSKGQACPHPARGPARFQGQRPKRPLLRLPACLLQAVLPGHRLLPHTAAGANSPHGSRAGPPVTWPWASFLGARAWLPVAMGTAQGTLGGVVPPAEGTEGDGGRFPAGPCRGLSPPSGPPLGSPQPSSPPRRCSPAAAAAQGRPPVAGSDAAGGSFSLPIARPTAGSAASGVAAAAAPEVS